MRAQRQASLSRRDLLKGMGGAIAGLALAGPLDLRGAVRAVAAGAPRIAIIGGGTAGLNAALTLQDAGYASTVVESASRLGGRMHPNSSGFWQNGQTSAWCGELIDTTTRRSWPWPSASTTKPASSPRSR